MSIMNSFERIALFRAPIYKEVILLWQFSI
jgi:hypothetical protein